MVSYPDIKVGDVFGEWTVSGPAEDYINPTNGSRFLRWVLTCSCGSTAVRNQSQLRTGQSRHCGCQKKVNLIKPGHRMGRITILSDKRILPGTSKVVFRARCDCGEEYDILSFTVTANKTRECVSCSRKTTGNKTKGKTNLGTKKHGWAGSPEYRAWRAMQDRCMNPKVKAFPNYGGRGIRVHESWVLDFPAFLAHIGPRPSPDHSLDRLNNDGHYEPGNVAWRNREDQNGNRRNTVFTEFDGVPTTISELARRFDMPYCKLHRRIVRLGWDAEDAVSIKDGRSFKPA